MFMPLMLNESHEEFLLIEMIIFVIGGFIPT